MKSRVSTCLLLLFAIVATSWTNTAWSADASGKSRPAIYDESVDGSSQIADALGIAANDDKHVLLQFGANWCPWCHLLHDLFEKDPAISAELASDYVVVLIDVNQGHNKEVNEQYGNPVSQGLPVLVVLDSEGGQLTTQNTGDLEMGNAHDPAKVLAFLQEWAPKK